MPMGLDQKGGCFMDIYESGMDAIAQLLEALAQKPGCKSGFTNLLAGHSQHFF
jgi:hypothetical protein